MKKLLLPLILILAWVFIFSYTYADSVGTNQSNIMEQRIQGAWERPRDLEIEMQEKTPNVESIPEAEALNSITIPKEKSVVHTISLCSSTDVYVLNANGFLMKIFGAGFLNSLNPETGIRKSAEINREFEINSGTALLTESETNGVMYDDTNNKISEFNETIIIDEIGYIRLDKIWLPIKETTTSTAILYDNCE